MTPKSLSSEPARSSCLEYGQVIMGQFQEKGATDKRISETDMTELVAICLYQQFVELVMEDQFTVSALLCVSKVTLWFWGAVLIWLLKIGCVESNPGPRTNEVIAHNLDSSL
jgi:hypothetical protein